MYENEWNPFPIEKPDVSKPQKFIVTFRNPYWQKEIGLATFKDGHFYMRRGMDYCAEQVDSMILAWMDPPDIYRQEEEE